MASTKQLNRYHLGRWYASYRFLIGFSLLLIASLNHYSDLISLSYANAHLFVLFLYFLLSAGQWLLMRYTHIAASYQLLSLFIVDIGILTALSFTGDGANLQVSLMFVMTIFTASLLLEKSKALGVTLIAVICVIYQHFIGSLFSASTSLNNIGNSVLLAILFCCVYALAQFSMRRFEFLENVNVSQAQELRRLQDISSYILHQVENGYLVLDENYHVVLTTPAACTFLGIPPVYAYQRKPLYNVQPELFDALHLDRLIEGDDFEFEAKQSLYQLHIRIQRLNIPNQSLTLLVLEDTRNINQRVQQLKLAALGQLSASIAHEIRNPLAAIAQANELSIGSDAEQIKMLSALITKQTQRIDQIIEDTLSMVRSRETACRIINLNTFIPAFLADNFAKALNQINYTVEDNLSIYFNEGQFNQVLVNLVRNAIHHNQSEHHHIELHVYTQHNHIRIDVKDFGSGVASSDIASLFQPFFSTEINGTGLGLYLSHSFCEANQAKLYYVEQQQGACFRIECLRVQHD
jgi:two-component system, NtrC family, sensor histidine kinase PilS